jgi:hypothetical protein
MAGSLGANGEGSVEIEWNGDQHVCSGQRLKPRTRTAIVATTIGHWADVNRRVKWLTTPQASMQLIEAQIDCLGVDRSNNDK